MGLISGIQAICAAEKLKKGGRVRLSYSQISDLVVNLFTAKHALTRQQFSDLYLLYRKFQTETEKTEVDKAKFIEMVTNVLRSFERIAPYEKYGAGNKAELAQLLVKIHSEIPQK